MDYFVEENSIVRQIWKNPDCVLLIFAGSAAEFALNKAVDWLYFTGKIPSQPLERLFSTVEYAQKIVFARQEAALTTIDSIAKIHQNVEQSRGQNIPDWAYRDVLYMLIDYSIRSYELLERKVNQQEKEEIFQTFKRLGLRMGLQNLPQDFDQWTLDRNRHLQKDLEKGKYTQHLFSQYKMHLGNTRYFLLLQMQRTLVPKIVYDHLFAPSLFPMSCLLKLYKVSKIVSLDKLLKSFVLPKKYKSDFQKIGIFQKL